MYNRPRIIVLCADPAAVRPINSALSRNCDMVWAREARGVIRLAGDESSPAAIIIDNTVPQVNAIELFQEIKKACPTARRILVSDYCDLGLIVQGLHTGAIQSIVYKPINAAELTAALGPIANAPVVPIAAPLVARAAV